MSLIQDDVKRKAEERERKKAEVRKRLEEAGRAGKKAKKGFLTPERKKKLRVCGTVSGTGSAARC